MSVTAIVILRSPVEDLDKADDWFAEVKEALEGKTNCNMQAQSSNHEIPIDIVKDPEDG